MASHSSILAWKIPWTEKPGGLQSIGSRRVGHNQCDLASTHCAGKGALAVLLYVLVNSLCYHGFAVNRKSISHVATAHNLFWLLSGAAKSSPASKPGSTPSRPSSAKRASSSGSASRSDKDLETQVIQLNEQVTWHPLPGLWEQWREWGWDEQTLWAWDGQGRDPVASAESEWKELVGWIKSVACCQ